MTSVGRAAVPAGRWAHRGRSICWGHGAWFHLRSPLNFVLACHLSFRAYPDSI